jgi:GT2 family glycosyltransferase
MKISIIIASANRPECLVNVLYDLQQQELPADEIIVVDQSSTPYQLQDCVHIRDTGRGPCRARNLGLGATSGEIVVFLDDDIRVKPDFLRHLCTPILTNQFVAVTGAICDSEWRYDHAREAVTKERVWRGRGSSTWIKDLTNNPSHPYSGLTFSFGTGCSAVLKSALNEVGPFDTFFDPDGAGEDREMGLRLFHAGYSIFYTGKAQVSHLGWPSGGRRDTHLTGRVYPLEKNLLYIVGKYFSETVLSEYSRCWSYSYATRTLSWSPRSWLQSLRRYLVAQQEVKLVKDAIKGSKEM